MLDTIDDGHSFTIHLRTVSMILEFFFFGALILQSNIFLLMLVYLLLRRSRAGVNNTAVVSSCVCWCWCLCLCWCLCVCDWLIVCARFTLFFFWVLAKSLQNGENAIGRKSLIDSTNVRKSRMSFSSRYRCERRSWLTLRVRYSLPTKPPSRPITAQFSLLY